MTVAAFCVTSKASAAVRMFVLAAYQWQQDQGQICAAISTTVLTAAWHGQVIHIQELFEQQRNV